MSLLEILAAALIVGVCLAWLRTEEQLRLIARDNRIVDQLAAGDLPAYPDEAELLCAAWRDEVRR